jgi:uncharacterized membrane protein YagU involved in acid resistance
MKWVPVLAAGVVGSFTMDLVQDGFSAIFERGRADDDRDEETEAIVSVVRLIASYVPYHLAKNKPAIVGRILHYTLGSAFAIAYCAVRERRREVGRGYGVPFGIALWLFSDVLLIPAAHLIRPQRRYSFAERLNAVLSHLAYAVTVEAVVRRADHDAV